MKRGKGCGTIPLKGWVFTANGGEVNSIGGSTDGKGQKSGDEPGFSKTKKKKKELHGTKVPKKKTLMASAGG